MDSGRFSHDELVRCCELMEKDPYKSMTMQQEEAAESSAPLAPSLTQQRIIEGHAASLPQRPPSSAPWWCRLMCIWRDNFEDCGIGAGGPDSDEIYLMLFAKQSPQTITFLKLRRVVMLAVRFASPSDKDCFWFDAPPGHQRVYESLSPLVICNELEVGFAEDADLFVHEALRFKGERIVTNVPATPFERFVAPYSTPPPSKPKAPAARRLAVSAGDIARILEEFPWLDEGDLPCPAPRRRATAHQSTGKRGAAKRKRRERSRRDDGSGSSSSTSSNCTEETVEPPGDEKKKPKVAEKKEPSVPKKKLTGEQEKEPTLSAEKKEPTLSATRRSWQTSGPC